MPTRQIDHCVASYDPWEQAFDSDPLGRAFGGVCSYRLARLADDPNDVVVDLEFETVAEAFAERLRATWSEAGPRLGLESPIARDLETVDAGDL